MSSMALFAEDVDHYFKEWMHKIRVPPRLHADVMDELQKLKGHGNTLTAVREMLRLSIRARLTPGERLAMDVVDLSDRDLLEAMYLKLYG